MAARRIRRFWLMLFLPIGVLSPVAVPGGSQLQVRIRGFVVDVACSRFNVRCPRGPLSCKSEKIQNQHKTGTTAKTAKYKTNTKLIQNQRVRRSKRAESCDFVLVLYWFCTLSLLQSYWFCMGFVFCRFCSSGGLSGERTS